MKIKLVVLFLIALGIVASPLFTNTAFAANYGNVNILDDGVMNNTSTLNATQINSFLNSFSGTCLGTNSGFSTPDPLGYSSGAYQYGATVDAGTAISHIAARYNVNPQVLLATLQKEQGLINGVTCHPESQGDAPQFYSWANSRPCAGPGDLNNTDCAAVTCGPNTTYTDCSYACKYGGGCITVALGYSCPGFCKKTFASFSGQISGASWALRFSQARSYGQLTGYPGYDSGDEFITYYGPMTQGFRQRVSGGQSVYYDGSYTDSDGNTMYITNGATASMLSYTPFYARSYTNDKVFHTSFVTWFGSTQTYIPPNCDAKVSGVGCVWRLDRPASDANFLTIDSAERDTAVSSSHFLYDGMPFYAYTTQKPGSIPVYRLRLSNEHFYTTSASEKDSLLGNSQNSYEGVAFYVYPSSTTTNASYPIYRLSNPSGHLFVSDPAQKDSLVNQGYIYEGLAFNAPSGFNSSAPDPSPNYINVYRLSNSAQHFYTTSLFESDSLARSGWNYEGILLQSSQTATSSPIYRLFNNNNDHIFTSSSAEKTSLEGSGWKYEGIAWYIGTSSAQTYRFYIAGKHFYTSSFTEALGITNNGARYEGIAFGSTQNANVPVFRLFSGTTHFFTADINESLLITNNGWRYEGIAWYASSTTTSTPIYRLVNGMQHFYTSGATERDLLAANGWRYEGIAWYASSTTTSTPIYRLKGPYYFYTTSTTEKNGLIARDWANEGIAWYGL